MAAKFDDNGMPTTEDEVWSDVMCAPVELFPYLFVSHSQLVNGEWSSFSNPVLWKKWENKEKDDKTDEAKKKHDEENKEKRARMSVLRGVAIRIPLLVYGAEILLEYDDLSEKDSEELKKWAEKKDIDLNNKSKLSAKEKEDILDWLVDVKLSPDYFTSLIDDASWEEFMPKGFTKETFNILKDCFDRSIFTGAAKRIRQMVKEADNLNTEDRIAKIATIFSYFHNPDKETVLTPWRVVNMHMSDTVGGWCFWDEDFVAPYTEENKYGENVNAARPVGIEVDENNQLHFTNEVTKDIFGDYNSRILEINSKTGLYPLYMAYSLFKGAKEPNYRNVQLTGERGKSQNAEQYYHQAGDDLEIWKDVLQDNIFVVCRTKMAVSITKRTLAGFRTDIRMNIRCYEHEVPVTDLVSAGVLKTVDEHVTKDGKTYFYNGHKSLECNMINVLRAKPELFQNDVVRGNDFWHVYNSIPKSKNEDINNMKFKAIVGNPPYQQNSESSNRNEPIYHLFYDSAFNLSDIVTFITPGRFLFRAGQTPKEWIEKMLSDEHFKVVKYYSNTNDVFPNVDIKGGVSITMRNQREKYGKIGTFTMYDELNTILAKVLKASCQYMSSVVYSKSSYSFTPLMYEENPTLLGRLTKGNENIIDAGIFGKMPELFHDSNVNKEEYIGIYGRENNQRVIKYIKKKYISPVANFNQFKVFIAGANGSGSLGEALSSPIVVGPGIAHTQTFMSIGGYSTIEEANSCLKYLKTKFARCLLGTLKVTQNNNKDVWANVPIQNFTAISEIDWNQSIADIDKQLYRKYKLDEDESDFIEKMVKPMD